MASSYRTPAGAELTNELVTELRKDYPTLSREVNGHPLAYLDTGATLRYIPVTDQGLIDYEAK